MNIFDSITTIGYDPNLDTNEQTQIKILNISVILSLLSVFSLNIIICIIHLKSTFVLAIILILFFILLGYVLILNSKRKYRAAKLLYVLSNIAILFILSIFLGNRFGIQTCFLVLTIVSFLYYSIIDYITIIMIAILNLSAYCYIEFFYKTQFIPLSSALMSNSVAAIFKFAVILICYIILAIILFSFQLVIYKNEKELKAALDKAAKIANYDGLTNLYNIRAFNQIMMDEVNIALEGETSLSLIITDIDHFKMVNDTYGHLMGDEVLKIISVELKNNLREDDSIARWGGEEFIIMLPHTDISGSKMVAEKLRLCIQELTFTNDMHITMSFGVAQYQHGDISNTVKKADDALYMAKHNGRNRVEIVYDLPSN